jgi:hypothetical protein
LPALIEFNGVAGWKRALRQRSKDFFISLPREVYSIAKVDMKPVPRQLPQKGLHYPFWPEIEY